MIDLAGAREHCSSFNRFAEECCHLGTIKCISETIFYPLLDVQREGKVFFFLVVLIGLLGINPDWSGEWVDQLH